MMYLQTRIVSCDTKDYINIRHFSDLRKYSNILITQTFFSEGPLRRFIQVIAPMIER